MNNCHVEFKKTNSEAKVPVYSRDGDACADIFSIEEKIIMPGQTELFDTGIKIQNITPGWQIKVNPRSGLAAKFSITVLNSPGTIDNNYRGNIMVILHNSGKMPYKVNVGDRIAQLEPQLIHRIVFTESETEDETVRGENGFGSSGK